MCHKLYFIIGYLIRIMSLLLHLIDNEHMANKKEHWEKIYKDQTPCHVSWYQETPTLSLKLIEHCDLKKSDAIIDIGGGTSVLIDYLIENKYKDLSVLDISENALSHTKARLGKNAFAVKWIAEDITSFVPSQKFSVWHDRAVFHFLTDANDRKLYLDTLKTCLIPKGFLILAAFVIDAQTQCSGLDIIQYNQEKLQRELGNQFIFIEQENETHITPGNIEQQFCYYRFQKK